MKVIGALVVLIVVTATLIYASRYRARHDG